MSKRDRDSNIKIVGADELPAEQPKQEGPPHPFSKMNRNATRMEVVNAAANIGKEVYDQIAEEHNKAMKSLYDEFAQFREVAARRIRELERWNILFQIQKSLRIDLKRFRQWRSGKLEEAKAWLALWRGTELDRLAGEAARINGEVSPELINQVELLAMIRSGQAVALRWKGNVEDLKDGPFAEFYHEGMTARSDGGIPIRDNDGTEEICAVGDLLLLKNGELSVVKGQVNAAQEATA